MIVTATELALDSERVLDRVVQSREIIEVQRNGRTVAEIHPRAQGTREDILHLLQQISWTTAESKELKQAMDAASDVIGYAGCD